MTSVNKPHKKERPQIFTLDKASKLVEQWVNNMTKIEPDTMTEVKVEGRPARLGLGAKVARSAKFIPSDDPVENKLHAKLEAGKRKAARDIAESILVTPDDDNDSDEEMDSRTSTFVKRPVLPTISVHPKKKQK